MGSPPGRTQSTVAVIDFEPRPCQSARQHRRPGTKQDKLKKCARVENITDYWFRFTGNLFDQLSGFGCALQGDLTVSKRLNTYRSGGGLEEDIE